MRDTPIGKHILIGAEALKELMGIPDDTIQTLLDDLNEKQMAEAIAEIRQLYSEGT